MVLLRLLRALSGVAHSGHDARIGPAAADVSLHGLPDLCIAWIRARAEKFNRRHDHAGGAVAALKRLFAEKCLLHRVQCVTLRESLDGRYVLSHGNRQRRHARSYGFAFQQDRARSALSFTAAVLGSGQLQFVAEYPKQGLCGGSATFALATVHEESRRVHVPPSGSSRLNYRTRQASETVAHNKSHSRPTGLPLTRNGLREAQESK